ncbi:MAG: choice-of-anchor J domain-containing protein [Saprospiraceae bacterium]|nr:choice-of-anchor J domain-containing protein [Saprospiraceae bacterium]
MRTFCTFLLFLYGFLPLYAQTGGSAPDTLLLHTFEGFLDPTDTMSLEPTGEDHTWVNYDQDNKIGRCVELPGVTPKGWYWESDLGVPPPTIADNDAITSCSYLSNPTYRNSNWLITPPVYLPDDTYWLCWRSLTYYGPDLMDGYQVLLSNTTNFPVNFTDTLFSVAATEESPLTGSLDLNDYVFSPGYIHANGYTDSAYFFIDYENGFPFYHGKLEPHSVSLADYAGQVVYLAFLHDSRNAYQLQLDDIVITNQYVSTQTQADFIYFNMMQNPLRDFAYVNWKTKSAQSGHIRVFDQLGKIVWEQAFGSRQEGQVFIDARTFPTGTYYCNIITPSGQTTRYMLKQ